MSASDKRSSSSDPISNIFSALTEMAGAPITVAGNIASELSTSNSSKDDDDE